MKPAVATAGRRDAEAERTGRADPVAAYASCPLFAPEGAVLVAPSPYRRPLRNHLPPDFAARRLSPTEHGTAAALAAHRMLFNVYEHDLMFLPAPSPQGFGDEFQRFYDAELGRQAQMLRPDLERFTFGFLDDEIEVSGPWTPETLRTYFVSVVEEHDRTPSAFTAFVLASADPARGIRNFLIQCAGDFLTEASGMARNLPGNFGDVQSELFKIFTDEYGYGVFATKHSTLYERLLADKALDPRPHAYWQYYLTASLAVHNYIHFITQNHRNFLRYLGALYYAEATYSHTCAEISAMIHRVFGKASDTEYFDEHVHIDRHHSRMVLDHIITPLLGRFGASITEDLVRGFEEFRLVLTLSDRDLVAQIRFMDGLAEDAARARALFERLARTGTLPPPTPVATRRDTVLFDVEDGPVLYHVVDGGARLVAGYEAELTLAASDAVYVPAGRPHALALSSDETRVHAHHLPHDVGLDPT